MNCSKCKGYRWFDDRGFVASGQPAFDFTPCSECNADGTREMWGNEVGDPGYKVQDNHRSQLLERNLREAALVVEDPSEARTSS